MRIAVSMLARALRLLVALACSGIALNPAYAQAGWVQYDFSSPPFYPVPTGGDTTPFTFGPTQNQGAPDGFLATFSSGTGTQWQVTTYQDSIGHYNPFNNGWAALNSLNPYAWNNDSLRIHTNMPFDAVTFAWVALGNWAWTDPRTPPTAVLVVDVPTPQVGGEVSVSVPFSDHFPGNTFFSSWVDGTQSLEIFLDRPDAQGNNWGSFAIANLWLHVTAIPEPSTMALMLVCLAVLVLRVIAPQRRTT